MPTTTIIETFLASATRPLIVLTGPTACGKTDFSIELCKKYNGEVINADSRQVYTDIRIGNALITESETQGVSHHFFSFRSPLETLTVAEYKTMVDRKIEEMHNRKVVPFLVGGSVMWIDAVCNNYNFPKEAFDPSIRKSVAKLTLDEQLSELAKVDPSSHANLVRERNPRYIGRALEIFRTTGKPKSAFTNGQSRYDVLKLAIDRPRAELYERINARVHHQLKLGLLEEVKTLVKTYLHTANSPLPTSFLSIGVKEVIPHLSGQITKTQMIADLQQASRNYAKRQLTWLRKDQSIIRIITNGNAAWTSL